MQKCVTCRFQSTLPVWGGTARDYAGVAGGYHFNPRSGWGARRGPIMKKCHTSPFQPTPPVGGATARNYAEETGSYHFNPRSPCGERQGQPLTT